MYVTFSLSVGVGSSGGGWNEKFTVFVCALTACLNVIKAVSQKLIAQTAKLKRRKVGVGACAFKEVTLSFL